MASRRKYDRMWNSRIGKNKKRKQPIAQTKVQQLEIF